MKWTGVYIGGPCSAGSGWTKTLLTQIHTAEGWTFMPIYVGQQSSAICGASNLSASQGTTDGNAAVARMAEVAVFLLVDTMKLDELHLLFGEAWAILNQFLGYLPRRGRELAALWEGLAAWPHPAVAFESPNRLPATLRSLAGAQPERPVAVCRELTKRFEEVVRGSATELAERLREPSKGEITLVLGGVAAAAAPADEARATAAVRELVEAGLPRRRAAEVVSGLTGVSRGRLYDTSL